MKRWQSLLLGVVLSNATALAQAPAPSRAMAADSPLEAVRTAPDPSSTIEAYARGAAAGGVGELTLRQAYVRHMFDLGAPELADAQAHELINRSAADATIRGVAAYNDAARGNARAAIDNLKAGLTDRPNDPFLLRTAGQVVAWYDSLPDRSSLSKEDVAGIEWLRAADRQEFADAYRMATAVRRRTAAEAAEAAASGPTTAAPTTQRASGEGSSVTRYESSQSTYYYPYSGYGSGYGYGYYYGYRPTNLILALRDQDFQHLRSLDRPGAFEGHTGPLPVTPNGRPSPGFQSSVARTRPAHSPPRPMQVPPRPPALPRPPGP